VSRLLIIGASGFIGQYLLQYLQSFPEHEVSGTYHTAMPQVEGCSWHQTDVTDPEQLGEVFRLARPEVVAHLAAMADVNQCQRMPQQSTEINVRGTENIARLCALHQAKLVLLSTEYVFSGDQGYYREDDAPQPTTHYGQTKWEAEQAVAREAEQWSILRTSLVYGWPSLANRGNLVTRLLDALHSGRSFHGYTDMYRSPVYVEDVVEGIIKLAQGDYPGVHHVAGPEWVNIGEFARTVAEVFDLDQDLVVLTPSPEEADSPRPRRLGLDSTRAVRLLGIQPLDMVSGLKQMQIKRRESPWQHRF
jgi:dTDP-4-dehydrorhamnose reductase